MSGTARIRLSGTNPRPLAFRGALTKLTADETVTDNISLSIPWDDTSYDTDGFWSSGDSTKLIIPVGSGITKIRLTGGIRWASGFTAGNWFVRFTKNGETSYEGSAFVREETPVTGSALGITISSPVLEVAEGDFFKLNVLYNTSTGTEDLLVNSTWFCIAVEESIPATAIDHAAAEFPRWFVHKGGTSQVDIGTSEVLVDWLSIASHGYDEGANIDLSTTFDFTVPAGAAGIYMITTNLWITQNGAGDKVSGFVKVDGSEVAFTGVVVHAANGNVTVSVTVILKLEVGEKVTITARTIDNAVSNIAGAATDTFWMGCRIA